MKIDGIDVCVIKDSRGEDTLEVTLTAGDFKASASVPSGKSKGSNEAATISPKEALDKIPWLTSQFKDYEFASLDQFDQLLLSLDGTENKSRLGGNLILALSIAFTRLLAQSGGIELFQLLARLSGNRGLRMPLCFFNLIEGGVHTPLGDLPYQEYLLVPQNNSPKKSLNEAFLFIGALGEKIKQEFGVLKYGDEGGYIIPSENPLDGLRILRAVRDETGRRESKFSLDAAATTLFRDGKYNVGGKILNREELLNLYQEIIVEFPILSIEDPFSEDDLGGFSQITKQLGDHVWIVADDLTTTNVKRIKLAYAQNAANAVIIKPNQIGTVSETIQAAGLARSYGWKIIVSHRSGETMDTFIADLAVGLGADGFKSGCPLRRERLVKYERLVKIEKCLT